MSPNKPARALILTANEFEDMELFFPYFRLLEEGVEVDIAGPETGVIHGEHGYSMKITKTIAEVNPEDYDILLVPGGFPKGAPATVRKIKKAQDIARSFFSKNKPVAAICHGPWLLVSADVVRGRHMTGFWEDGVPEQIEAAGGIYEDRPVVVDGNLVTSRWPADLPAFVREVVRLVRERPAAP
jgi:protease I